MEAKLIKTEVNYLLENEEGVIIASTSLKKEGLALSLKNCQAIESGYDLDELAKQENGMSQSECSTIDEQFKFYEGYKSGFQKALSILGDKKFNEDDIRKAILLSMKYNDNAVIKSLQQTEWDVWLVMACGLPDGCTEPEVSCTCDIIPSLDADGCLILKRI